MKILFLLVIALLQAPQTWAECYMETLTDTNFTYFDAEKDAQRKAAQAGELTECRIEQLRSNSPQIAVCEAVPGECDSHLSHTYQAFQRGVDPWCYLKRIDLETVDQGRKAIDQEIANNPESKGPYTCTLMTHPKDPEKPYWACESEAEVCRRVLNHQEKANKILTGVLHVPPSGLGNEFARGLLERQNEGYVMEYPRGRRLWCDIQYGCRPR